MFLYKKSGAYAEELWAVKDLALDILYYLGEREWERKG
jgi:hypothetical protein